MRNAPGSCFSGDCYVTGRDGNHILLKNLQISQEILQENENFQNVLTFLDYSKTNELLFCRLECEDGNFLEASPEHLVYIKFKHDNKEGIFEIIIILTKFIAFKASSRFPMLILEIICLGLMNKIRKLSNSRKS